jgi:hypothetical protein
MRLMIRNWILRGNFYRCLVSTFARLCHRYMDIIFISMEYVDAGNASMVIEAALSTIISEQRLSTH